MKIIRQRQISITAGKASKFFAACPRCDGSMFETFVIGKMLPISEAAIYRLIENEQIHFTKHENALYVCVQSLLEKIQIDL